MACETIIEPAPIDIKVICRPHSESNPKEGNKGKTIEDEEIIATVEDPWAVLKSTVNKNGMSKPNLFSTKILPKTPPKFSILIISPNAPPMAIIAKIGPAFSMAFSNKWLISVLLIFLKSISQNSRYEFR